MPAKRVIACLDVDGGRVVKGRRFVELRDAGDPAELAMRYCAEGADEIVLLDISASIELRLASRRTIEAIARAVNVPLTVGGGVRTVDDAASILGAGADKVAVNSAAVARPEMIAEMSARFGSQCVVVSIDARKAPSGYAVATHGARVDCGYRADSWAVQAEALGAGEILLTSIDRDGEVRGFDLELISLIARSVSIPTIASGGARDADSFVQAFSAGADAALGASIFHFGYESISNVKCACRAVGIVVRP